MFSSLIICCNSSVLGLYKVFGFTWNMKKGRWNNSCLWRAAFVYFDLYAPNSYGCIGKVFPLSPYSLIFYSAICNLSSCKTPPFILQDFIFYFTNLYLLFNKLYSFGFAKLSFLYWKPDILCGNSIPFIILSTISYYIKHNLLFRNLIVLVLWKLFFCFARLGLSLCEGAFVAY